MKFAICTTIISYIFLGSAKGGTSSRSQLVWQFTVENGDKITRTEKKLSEKEFAFEVAPKTSCVLSPEKMKLDVSGVLSVSRMLICNTKGNLPIGVITKCDGTKATRGENSLLTFDKNKRIKHRIRVKCKRISKTYYPGIYP